MLDINTRLYNNNNIHVKINGGAAGVELSIILRDLGEALFWNDTYIYGGPVCFGNDCGAFTFYNYNRACIYYLTDRDINKLKAGHNVILYATEPDENDREILELFGVEV